MRLPILIWLSAALLATGSIAAKSEPSFSKKKFDGRLVDLIFFDDSEVALVTDRDSKKVYQSNNAGAEWAIVEGLKEGDAIGAFKHPYDNHVAFILGRGKTHLITKDQGKTWKPFKTDGLASPRGPIQYHATDSNRYLYQGDEECSSQMCRGTTWYTEDAFETTHLLYKHRRDCIWAKSTDAFTTGHDVLDQNTVLCVVEGKHSEDAKDYRLLITNDYFKSDGVEPRMADGRTVSGMSNIAAVKGNIVVAAASERTRELALYVTDDTKTWHRAEFGQHRIEEDAYTILESTNYSIQVDVRTTTKAEFGNLFTSNSNGTYFTKNIEHTNRNEVGIVDFEKVSNIQGIVIVNTVNNYQEMEKYWLAEKQLKSAISFDDGRTFQPLKVGDEELHLHSVTNQHNSGRVFSSPAPGIVMGVGNTGKYLKDYTEGDLYVSDNAGATWIKALDEAHKYEFGGQGSLLVAVFDEGETDKVMYSINHGRDWESATLPDKIRAHELTTVPDSTSLKFILSAVKGGMRNPEFILYSIDFGGLHERECKDSDMEKWYARVDSDKNPKCIMGHTQSFQRRKPDADCFVNFGFKEALPQSEPCDCTDEDFECDFNFVRSEDRTECRPVGALQVPQGECQNSDGTFMGSSGWRKIAGDDCKRKSGPQKDDKVKRPCSETHDSPASGDIQAKLTKFKSKFVEYFYLERHADSDAQDETVVVLTRDNIAHVSHDHGKTWTTPIDDNVVAIYPHQYNDDTIYFITPSERVHYTSSRGKRYDEFKAPEPPNQDKIQILGFHPDEPDWLLWVGGAKCSGAEAECHTVAHVSTKGGDEWKVLMRYVEKCKFVPQPDREKHILCEQYKNDDTHAALQLQSSDDWFEHKTTLFEDIVSFATMSEFVIVAQRADDRQYLKVDASIDGTTFAPALFPPGFNVAHQQAYTVLDSSTHAIFMHVTINNVQGQEYGTIIKSNSNGTSYVLSLNGVNRNRNGYVDFEKMVGLEGVAIVNIVANTEEVDGGGKKKIKTKITHNDGADWTFMPPPAKDSDGKAYSCGGQGVEKCSLHLHGYTERDDPRDTYASQSAIGLMMGVGNVGEFLAPPQDDITETFITRDGGITWTPAMKGRYMWEYGDQGSIIVIVKKHQATRMVYFSTDEGAKWTKYEFSDTDLEIADITTLPSDNSRNFILWGRDFIINLDFTGLTNKQCNLDKENPEAPDSDYYLWEPKHPLQEGNCLFGHIAQYYRKKPEAECYNGKKIDQFHKTVSNCACVREDFECDYNYQKQSDGSCDLVPGLSPKAADSICASNHSIVEYYDPTGYRKIPISTCVGGSELEYTAQSHPCPGHEDEYKKKHAISGVGLFFAIVLPIAAACGVGYWVWRNGVWDGKFGRIRLGEPGQGAFDQDSPLVRWPIAAISAIVAIAAAVPMVVGSLWRTALGAFGRGGGGYGGRTYRSREAFARGRGQYSGIGGGGGGGAGAADGFEDEGELLGSDSDEEV
ncbi:vacuolar protein sorting protein [Aulographum hederae CBS 113979]|uniref:Vacuolar protein sorting/targeting protein 10 n=1 Tax=Aulographum hederae CBS 113979 TaxID=1176131 RepID=A0A6G1HFR3_9PEZI|nr:vacuolar protein sorting protein [Aulographum hederae CBS 113979]